MKKIVVLLLICSLISCAQYTKGNKTSIPLSQEALINSVIKTLNLDKSEIEIGDIVSKVSPNNSEETIIIIPEVLYQDEDQDVFNLNTNIVIVDNITGKIKHKYFESSKTNGWVSDAVFIDQITIDTVAYKLNTSKTAFGVTVKFRSSSQPNPYNSESISLFTKNKNSLGKILDFYTIYERYGQVNVNIDACYADIKSTANILSMSNTKTNGYHDIIVKSTTTQTVYSKDENGECNPKETMLLSEESILKYNTEEYITQQ